MTHARRVVNLLLPLSFVRGGRDGACAPTTWLQRPPPQRSPGRGGSNTDVPASLAPTRCEPEKTA